MATVNRGGCTPNTRRGRYKPDSEKHKSRLKRQRTGSCRQSLEWLEEQGYVPLTVTMMDMSSGKEETVRLQDKDITELFGLSDEINDDALDTVNMMLYLKEWYNISHGAYHELAKVCKEMPRQYKIKQRISELNQLWRISPTPNNTQGVQQSRLEIRIRHLVSNSDPNSPLLQEKVVRVKLSGDGTKIGKRLHVVAFTFTLLDENQYTSAAGNHILAVFKQPESYDCLKLALADIVKEAEELKKITIDETTFDITYYLGGDWKFLALVTGVDAASSDYACIWCKCKKDERYDVQRLWSISDTDKGAKTIQENIEISERGRSRKAYNVSHTPLFKSIPLTHIVIDNLHLFLHTSDVLIDLIVEVRRQDAIENVKKFTNPNLSRYQHIQNYQKFISSLGIPGFEFYIGRTSKELKCRSLTGPEKLKVLRNFNIQTLLPRVSSSRFSICGKNSFA